MKAFWWFRKDKIAGMARPGFNAIRWLELSFDEAVLLGWLGQFSESSSQSHESLIKHVISYGPKIGKFHGINESNFQESSQCFYSEDALKKIIDRLIKKTKIFKSGDVTQGKVHFEFCKDRFNWELEFLKNNNISAIITLTEHPHSHDTLKNHFDVYHFSIEDLNAPRFEQAEELSRVFHLARDKKIAVHCLAGIGRTSTMIMAAHMILGENQKDLEREIQKQNIAFALSAPQRAFVESVTDKLMARNQ